jgi:hypothetical protein
MSDKRITFEATCSLRNEILACTISIVHVVGFLASWCYTKNNSVSTCFEYCIQNETRLSDFMTARYRARQKTCSRSSHAPALRSLLLFVASGDRQCCASAPKNLSLSSVKCRCIIMLCVGLMGEGERHMTLCHTSLPLFSINNSLLLNTVSTKLRCK